MTESGGCLCGAVRYRFERGAAAAAFDCHCTDCQKATGCGKATIVFVPTEALEVSGELRGFTVTGTDGARVTREFCPACGSQMISHVAEDPANRFVKAGSLDDPSWVRVSASFWASSSHRWSPVAAGVPSFPGNPTEALG